MNEDEIAKTVINFFGEERTVKPEVHYNHYGDRGVVDLVIEDISDTNYEHLQILELKAENAVEQATGANEIIRQFNRHREYFFEGTDYREARFKYNFELAFAGTETCINHILENRQLYQSVVEGSEALVSVFHPAVSGRGRPLIEPPHDHEWLGEEKFSDMDEQRSDSTSPTL